MLVFTFHAFGDVTPIGVPVLFAFVLSILLFASYFEYISRVF